MTNEVGYEGRWLPRYHTIGDDAFSSFFCASEMSDAADETRQGGLILVNAPKCNVVGAYVIAGYVLVLASYLSSCVFTRWLASRGKMPEVAAGKFRLAAATGRVDMMIAIKKSLDAVFDIDCHVLGFTALHAAVCQGQLGAVLWLLQSGADVEKVKQDGWMNTALHYAASRGNEEILRVLFAHGARLDRENFAGETAAQAASNMGHRLAAKLLKDLAGRSLPSYSSSGAGSTAAENEEAMRCQMRASYDGCYFEKRINAVTRISKWEKKFGQVSEVEGAEFEEYMTRGNEGYGSAGTEPGRHLRGFRRIAVVYLIVSFLYLLWRALRSLNPGWWYFYSIPFFMIEVSGWTLGLCFLYSLFYQIDRPSRSITRMMEQEEFPKIDVYICRYSEPVEVLEATTVAALNMDYPGEKLSIYVLDDGNSEEVRAMCTRLSYQLRYMERRANLHYVARTKKPGVPHHAKAGNINNALLMHSPEDTQYILVLDCDMIIHPTFLHRTLSHFYVQTSDDRWRQKQFVGLLQTPQDFWNVDSEDPMVHCARFFYGPMLQGRDGAGACPCCGTGVIFQRSSLVSVGGQSYGSITEDCNTSMQLLSSGFANMFLNERLVYGMAPEDLPGVFHQRARWAMGAIQILYRDNPLRKRGLSMSQSFLFFEIGAHHYLAIGTVLATLVPLVYVYVEASPVIVEHLWEFCIVFAVFFFTNRLMIWWAHRGCASGGMLELWRGGQMWIWMCPSHVKAIFKTFISETKVFRCFGSFQLTFNVTSKGDEQSSFWESLGFASPFVLYLMAVLGSTIYFIIVAILRNYSTWTILMTLTAIAWSGYISLCIWPPVSVLIPRVETDQGWKISWDTAIDESKLMVDEKRRVVRRPKRPNAASRANLDRGANSMVSQAVLEMEEGAHAYDFASLTKHAVDTFRPKAAVDDPAARQGSPGSSQTEDFFSPFENYPGDQPSLYGSDDLEMANSSKVDGITGRLQQYGSRLISSLGGIVPHKSMTLSQRASELNIGRVALPRKTARGIAGSMFTSVILPEPSRVKFDRSMSMRAGSDDNAGFREDVRHLSLQRIVSQDSMRRSLILINSLSRTGSDDPTAARKMMMEHSKLSQRFGSAHPSIMPVRDDFVVVSSRSKVEQSSNGEIAEPQPLHIVLSRLGSSSTSSSASLGLESPFLDGPGYTSAVIDGQSDEVGEPASFTSPFLLDAPSGFSTESGLADALETGRNPNQEENRRRKFVLTTDGRLMVSGREVGLDALLGHVVNEMRLSSGPMGSMNLESPMMDVGDSSVLSSADESAIVQSYGESLLRSMSQSWRENLQPDGQRVVELQRRMIPTSIIMGEMATETLGRRVGNKPGSIMISSIFCQLSQMEPSVLQKQGIMLPVIPDDVFEHTIASKPSFEFRVLPDKTVMFFTVNIAILLGVCAGGIVSIFFTS